MGGAAGRAAVGLPDGPERRGRELHLRSEHAGAGGATVARRARRALGSG